MPQAPGLLCALVRLEPFKTIVGTHYCGKSRGLLAWIRFKDWSLWCLLEGVEACFRDEDLVRWSKAW